MSEKMEFEIGDEVEIIEVGTIGEIVEICNDESKEPFKVKIPNGNSWNFSVKELKLLPKYKTLAQLWEESDRRPFWAIDGRGNNPKDAIEIVGIKGIDAIYSKEDKYLFCFAESEPVWQLYQEPAEQPPEEKSAEKCEHKRHRLCNNEVNIECIDCGVELVEKWLWIYKSKAGDYCCSNYYYTNAEAESGFGSDLIKKASNTRELFEVGK